MALDDDIALMARVPLFASLGDEPVRLLAFSAETRFLGAGDVLFKEGQAADSGYVVAAGRVTLESEGEIGEFIAGPGSLIGEIALIIETLRPATATARDPATVLRIPRSLFRRVLTEFPDAAQRIHQDFRDKMRATTADLLRVGRLFERG
ncbi:cyclic nucleotide-binding domain-containing protein [Phreatobacter oligotrophus]|uniref:cyclic nucleotide-binding domain-containing protein n=1 Tax=Phreatobacter oligotrophus TaxID=1122261 RepID=UPI002357B9BF|nr:cyclic nucleotide-binding domain-containing protein [Phreatobacter oligotrophus]MBX9992522.1 cyclic nucleotide-binding domain-containing protein [Phreatobacter oligotrophus]